MLKRLRDVAIAALFGAGILAFGIAAWSASSCDPHQKTEKATTDQNAYNKTCDAFKISPFKGLGVFLGNNATEIAAGITAIATFFIAFFTFTLKKSTGNLWEETKRSVKISERSLEISERPWITVTEINILEATNLGKSPKFKLAFVLKNSGHLPAFVKVFVKVILNPPFIEVWQIQKKFCADAVAEIKAKGWEYESGGAGRFVVFPNDPWPYHRSGVPLDSDVSEIKEYTPFIVGCVIYQSPFNDTLHKSPFFGTMSVDIETDRLVRDKITPISRDGQILVVKAISIAGDAD